MVKKCGVALLLLSLAANCVHASFNEGRYHKRFYKKWCASTALFDCAHPDPSGCPERTKAECEAECDGDANCKFLFYGWNPLGEYWRCAGFETCDEGSLHNYDDTNAEEVDGEEDPVSISIKPDGVYLKVAHDVWCGGDAPVMDCYDTAGCAPYANSQKACEDSCSATEGCNFLLYGWNPIGQYWRCTGFSKCGMQYVYGDGDPSILMRIPYVPVVQDKWCGGPAPVMDCFDRDNEDPSGCAPYTDETDDLLRRKACEDECSGTADCNFLLYGWNPWGGYWRCTGFSECSTQLEYLDGDDTTISAPSTYVEVEDEGDSWCGGEGALFDCFEDENCHDFDTMESCEAACNSNPDCNYMVWGWNPTWEYFRCAGFRICDEKFTYWNGDVTVRVKGGLLGARDWYRKEAVGGYGGQCYCPGTGMTYWVGDELNSCASLACENGIPLSCDKVVPPEHSDYIGYKVTCLPQPADTE